MISAEHSRVTGSPAVTVVAVAPEGEMTTGPMFTGLENIFHNYVKINTQEIKGQIKLLFNTPIVNCLLILRILTDICIYVAAQQLTAETSSFCWIVISI